MSTYWVSRKGRMWRADRTAPDGGGFCARSRSLDLLLYFWGPAEGDVVRSRLCWWRRVQFRRAWMKRATEDYRDRLQSVINRAKAEGKL